jgi:hypothetical protein
MYRCKDGREIPLFEADYDIAFTVYKKDRRGAVIGDPNNCLEAKSICDHNPDVIEAYIGSGKEAYIVFRETDSRPFEHALHFIIPTRSSKVRDAFDTKKGVDKQILWLRRPTKSRTAKARAKSNKERRKAIKAGAPVKKRGSPKTTRMYRLGVDHRPRAKIKHNVVSVGMEVD